jgi:hypothetical protein
VAGTGLRQSVHNAPAAANTNAVTGERVGGLQTYSYSVPCLDLAAMQEALENQVPTGSGSPRSGSTP